MSVAFSASGEVLVWSGRPRPLPLTLNLAFVSLPENPFVLVWSGHSCPLPLKLILVWVLALLF
jgi:hypothetical protein